MEAFSLINYWRGGGGGGGGTNSNSAGAGAGGGPLPTLLLHTPQTQTTTNVDQADGGPFFDLEFALPDHHAQNNNNHKLTHHIIHDHHHKIQEEEEEEEEEDEDEEEEEDECDSDESDGENEKDGGELIEFALSSCSSGCGGANITDPSDDLFFKGRLVSIDAPTTTTTSEHHAAKSQFLQKSATKFRVLMLKLKKSKCNADAAAADQQQQPASASKFLTVKFKVEDVPIMSLFFKDSSSSSSKSQKQIGPSDLSSTTTSTTTTTSSSDHEKRFSKDLMQRYLNKVKPLYVRVSKRYALDKPPKFTEQLTSSVKPETTTTTEVCSETTADQTPSPVQKQGNLQAGLRVVYKHLGKSRSASSDTPLAAVVTSRRRDDSLLEQQDGIQGAILHCKRSFNASRDSASSSIFDRTVSYPEAMAPEELEGFIFNE